MSAVRVLAYPPQYSGTALRVGGESLLNFCSINSQSSMVRVIAQLVADFRKGPQNDRDRETVWTNCGTRRRHGEFDGGATDI